MHNLRCIACISKARRCGRGIGVGAGARRPALAQQFVHPQCGRGCAGAGRGRAQAQEGRRRPWTELHFISYPEPTARYAVSMRAPPTWTSSSTVSHWKQHRSQKRLIIFNIFFNFKYCLSDGSVRWLSLSEIIKKQFLWIFLIWIWIYFDE